MARITVEDCLNKIDNQFDLVMVAAKRARRLANGADPLVEIENDKPTVIALREIADETQTADELRERLIESNQSPEQQRIEIHKLNAMVGLAEAAVRESTHRIERALGQAHQNGLGHRGRRDNRWR